MTASASDPAALGPAGMGRDDLGPLAGRPMLAVALDAGPGGDADVGAELARLGPVPCVVVGVHRRGPRPAVPPGVDLAVSTEADPPAPWVSAEGDLDAALERLDAAVRASPLAAVTLVQLLRLSECLEVTDALVAESLAYATLQAGPEHARWLADQRPATPGGPGPTATTARRGSERRDAPVRASRDGGRLTLTLDRPRVHNALSAAMRDALVELIDMAAADPAVRALALEGAGPSFCAGGDLAEFGTTPDPTRAHLIRTTRSPAATLAATPVPVSVRLHGTCRGAGVELAAFADRVSAAPAATLALPELAMGLVPGAGGTVSIARRIGRHRTAHLAITGEVIDTATARAWGLIDAIGPVGGATTEPAVEPADDPSGEPPVEPAGEPPRERAIDTTNRPSAEPATSPGDHG